jgi:hypothetical protein
MAEKEVNREIHIGEHLFHLAEDNILYITVVGEQDEKTALAMKEAAIKFTGMVEDKLNIFVDNSKAGKASPAARKLFNDLMDLKEFGRIAIFGAHPVARVLATFVIGISRKKDVRFFSSREKALAWLRK